MFDEIAHNEAQSVSKKYKMDLDVAKEKVLEILNSYLGLQEKLNEAGSFRNFQKTHLYKDLVKKIRKTIYYNLRQYHQKEAAPEKILADAKNSLDHADTDSAFKKASELSLQHLSTKERFKYLGEFNSQVKKMCAEATDILDLGGGLLPVTFPYSDYKNLKRYIWIDRDKKSYQTLKEFLDVFNIKCLELHNDFLENDIWNNYLATAKKKYDVVFMLKLIPVLWRQQRSLVHQLARVPAKLILVTGSKEAMVKRQDIQKREDVVLKRFVGMTGKRVVGTLDIKNEFGYFISS